MKEEEKKLHVSEEGFFFVRWGLPTTTNVPTLTFRTTTGVAIHGAMAVLPIAVRHTGRGGVVIVVMVHDGRRHRTRSSVRSPRGPVLEVLIIRAIRLANTVHSPC